MILIAVGLLSGFAPGILYPDISERSARLARKRGTHPLQLSEKPNGNGAHEMAGVRSSGETPDPEAHEASHGGAGESSPKP
jgi:hypothetical protein